VHNLVGRGDQRSGDVGCLEEDLQPGIINIAGVGIATEQHRFVVCCAVQQDVRVNGDELGLSPAGGHR